MADTYNIEILLKAQLAESQKIVKAINEITQKTNELTNQSKNMGKIWSGVLYDVGAKLSNLALKIPNLATSAIKAFGEEEIAVQKLSAAIRASGGDVSAVVPIFKEFASEMQRATVFADDQILAIQGVATSMGVLPTQMQQVIQGAIGLSSALGMDLQSATRASAAAVQGKTELLTRYIPMLSECKTAEEKFAKVQELSRSGFAQAKAEADSTLGKLKQCANAWGDLSEVIGGMFAPVVTDVAVSLKSMCELLSKNQGFTLILTEALLSAGLAFSFARIGGLTSVVRMFKLVALSIQGTTLATKTLTTALKATPWGAVLGVATTAVMGLVSAYSYFKGKAEETYQENIKQSKEYRDALDAEMDSIKQWGLTHGANAERTREVRREIEKYETLLEQSKTRVFGESLEELTARTDNYKAKIEKLNEVLGVLSNAQELNKLALDRQKEATDASNKILKKSAEEMEALKSKTSELEYIRKQYTETENKIVELDNAFKENNIAVSERVAKASELASARKQLVSLAQQELSLALEINNAENTSKKTSALQVQYSLEKQIAEAVSSGNVEKSKELQKELESCQATQEKLELVNSYMDSLKSTVKSETELRALQVEAEAYATSILKKKQEEADTEKYLASLSTESKQEQRSLEFEILQARASGNEAQAKELEGKLRISQLANEIFEATRKEGMSKKELESLQAIATNQAQERYNLEKSITDEAERQNLAKNAQAQIEDIIMANKIEQLKAEGKITEAKELEREREIKRTLAGMGDAVSEEDKKKLGDMMRSTNSFRDKQQERSSGMGGSSSFGGSGGFSGGRGASSVGGRKRPATVSEKNAALYEEYQQAKKAGTAKDGWNAFRDSRNAQLAKEATGGKNTKLQAQARGFLNRTEATAKSMTNRQAQAPKKPEPPKATPATSSALNNKLSAMGVEQKNDNSQSSSGEEVSLLKEIKNAITSMHNDIKTKNTKNKDD